MLYGTFADSDLLKGVEAVSWYNVRKVFSTGAFVSVTSGPLRGTMGWVERVVDDTAFLLVFNEIDSTVYFIEYEEKGNLSTSSSDIKVGFILLPVG